MTLARYVAITLAGIGLYIAAYFSLVYYGVVRADTRLMPRVCQLEEKTCQTVLSTRYARVFGVPNSALGVIYYLAVIGLVLTGLLTPPIGIVLIVGSWFTVLLGLYLAYSLFFIIKIPCPLCLAAHLINLGLALVLTWIGSSLC